MLTTGGVSSIFRLRDAPALFPALSNVVPETAWFSPSEDTTSEPGQEAMPEVASLQAKLTSTLVLFQPNPFGGGVANSTIAGRSLSTPITVMVSDAPGLPRSSTAIVFLDCRVTARSRAVTLGSKSPGPETCAPFTEITALATPLLSMCSAYCVLGFSTVKASLTVCGLLVRRVYVDGPSAFQAQIAKPHVAVVSVGEGDAVCGKELAVAKLNIVESNTNFNRRVFMP